MAEAITLKKEDISKPMEGMTKAIIDANKKISKLVTASIGSIKTTLIPGMSDLFKSETRKKADEIAKTYSRERDVLKEKQRAERADLSRKHALDGNLAKELALKEKEHQDALINLEKERRTFDSAFHKEEIAQMKRDGATTEDMLKKQSEFKAAINEKTRMENAQLMKETYDEKIKQQAIEHDTKIAEMVKGDASEEDILKEKDKQVGEKVDLAGEADKAQMDATANKEETEQTNLLEKIAGKDDEKESKGLFGFLKDNWKMIAIGLAVLLTPLEDLYKVFIILKDAFMFFVEHPLLTAIGALVLWFKGGAMLKYVGGVLKTKLIGPAMEGMKNLSVKAFDGIKNLSSKAFDGMKGLAGKGFESMKALGSKLGGSVMEMGGKIGGGAKNLAGKANMGGLFGKLIGGFGKAGKFLMQIGSKLLMPLITMGPLGWGIIAGVALGGLVYVYWDEIKNGITKAFGFISGGIKKLFGFVSNIFSDVKGMVIKFLRGVGAGMIADWLDDKKPEGEKEKFSWGNLMGDIFSIYTGIWKKILGFLSIDITAIRSGIAGWLRGVGAGLIADWIEPDETKKTGEKFTFLNLGKAIFSIYTGYYGTIMRLLGIDVDGIRSGIAGWLRSIGAGIIANFIEPDKEKKIEAKPITFVNIMEEMSKTISEIWKKLKGFITDIDIGGIAKKVAKGLWKSATSWMPGMGGDEDDEPEVSDEDKRAKEEAMAASRAAHEERKRLEKEEKEKAKAKQIKINKAIAEAKAKAFKEAQGKLVSGFKSLFGFGKKDDEEKPLVSPAAVTTDGIKGIVKSAGGADKEKKLQKLMASQEYEGQIEDDIAIAKAYDQRLTSSQQKYLKLKAGITPEEKQQKFQNTQQANLEMKNGVQVPIVVNAPVTNNNINNGGGGGTSYITSQKASHDTIWEKTLYK